jgi:HlyD family secretion protein
MIIGSEAISAELASIEKRILENTSAITDLNELLTIRLLDTKLSWVKISTKLYFAEYKSLARLIDLQAQTYQRHRSEFLRAKKLYEQKVISEAEYEASYFAFRLEQQNLAQILAQALAKWELELSQRRNDSIILDAELQRCNEELKNRVLIAPVSGEIIQSRDKQSGTMVYSNQQIAELSPEGEIIGLCYVSPREIGMIKTGLTCNNSGRCAKIY